MRKILSIAAAAAAIFSAAAAHAEVVLIDNFNGPTAGVSITQNTVGTTAAPSFNPTTVPGGSIATTRNLSISCTVVNIAANGCITANVGGGASNGYLSVSTGTANNGTASVTWTIPAFTVLPPASYFFSVIAAATGAGAATTIDFTFTGASSFTLNSQVVPATVFSSVGTPLNFGLTNAQVTALSGGGSLTMALQGGQGWNLTIDQFALSTPEPTSLALVGLALVGAGVVSRRRKA